MTLWDLTVRQRFCDGCAETAWQEEQAGEQARATQLRLERCGGTSRHRTFSWENATRPEVAQGWVRRYRAGGRHNLFLTGTVGAGKTGLAWLIVKDICQEKQGLFVNFRDLLWEIRQSFNSGNRQSSRLAAQAQTVAVLALDDLGAERPTEWAGEELATLVDRRYGQNLPTIVTSNYSPSDLAGRLGRDDQVVGQRIVSRLTENAEIVLFDNQDRRL